MGFSRIIFFLYLSIPPLRFMWLSLQKLFWQIAHHGQQFKYIIKAQFMEVQCFLNFMCANLYAIQNRFFFFGLSCELYKLNLQFYPFYNRSLSSSVYNGNAYVDFLLINQSNVHEKLISASFLTVIWIQKFGILSIFFVNLESINMLFSFYCLNSKLSPSSYLSGESLTNFKDYYTVRELETNDSEL